MKPGQLLQPPHCAQQMGSLFPLTPQVAARAPTTDGSKEPAARWKRGIDSERPITEATGLLCWRDFHPQEWQLASLHQIRSDIPPPLVRLPEVVYPGDAAAKSADPKLKPTDQRASYCHSSALGSFLL